MFSNDGALCMEDLLELIHQRTLQGADQTCAMDWTYVGDHPTFYDVWIARGMTGDSFLEIPASGSWDRVRAGYSDDTTMRIKALKGHTSLHAARESDDTLIDWDTLPPQKVKGMPSYQQQSFVAWHEGMAY
ncbi:hypothetical protein AG0111_0g11695 [Alternaria gaisen]|uniref:Uncharacterized protein n=1 Tax=Alternaria gaisen TaxID=167740 RepID=A0ACB6F6Q0_9PLEO|nr:uncharacterized protein J4E82_010671 [Alternaria postmessia]KAB2100106.1 hypothetical protein AG0111_0g11695 [Alternaria gaisen]KAI5368532.1 hypothetical protein J4E82_010671 [Alternaria postmessia]